MMDIDLKSGGLIWRIWFYFRTGNSVYLMFIISFLNFIAIQYKLIIETTFLKEMINSIYLFIILFAMIYIPTAITFGYLHLKRRPFKEEAKLAWEENPAYQELIKKLDEIENKL